MDVLVKGTIISPLSKSELLFLHSGFMAIDDKGRITEIQASKPSTQYSNVLDFSGKLICPGFVDIHNHLPQFTISGLYRGNLLEWLNNIVFPTEEKLANAEIAEKYAREFFRTVLSYGTTTSVSYVTVHKKATEKAFEQAEQSGIRAFLGNVMMDQKAPEYLIKDTAQLLQDSEEIIRKWDGADDGRLHYILTPRFAPACSFDLLEGIGKLAQTHNLHIQSHLAESKPELDMVEKIYSDFENYTDVYLKAGLLTEKTIMAHCIYLSDDEINMLKRTGTKISHCPSSNRFLQSGIMPLRKLEKEELVIGLGTDVGAGYCLSMFSEMREAIESSKTINFLHPDKDYIPLSPAEAFYLATLGGARVLSIGHETGSLDIGKSADFTIIDYQKLNPCQEEFFSEPENILARMIYGGAEKYIEKVFVRGKEVLQIG